MSETISSSDSAEEEGVFLVQAVRINTNKNSTKHFINPTLSTVSI
jgi:hypothetical protein